MASLSLVDISKLSPKFQKLYPLLKEFVEKDCIPSEGVFESQVGEGEKRWASYPPVMEVLKKKARSLGLWNLFLGRDYAEGAGLTNLEYSLMAEEMGRSIRIAPEACNCSAPDTGNMEVFAKYGTPAQKKKWLEPLLDGKIRSAFAMTEKNVASSDATNIETSIHRVGDEYIVNGHKWWISGAGDPRCKVFLVLGKSDAGNKDSHRQQSIIIVPAGTPGVHIVRAMTVFGGDDAPEGHCEIIFKNVRVPAENIVLGEGRGFEVIQGRLGPGRIHHCMRAIGMCERVFDYLLARVTDPSRKTFGKLIAEHGTTAAMIAQSRMEINQARFLVLDAADKIDKSRAKGAMKEIGMAKVVVARLTCEIIDRTIQMHGAAGLSQDFPFAKMYSAARALRFADGPDEIHMQQIGRIELKRAAEATRRIQEHKKMQEQQLKKWGLSLDQEPKSNFMASAKL